MLDPVAESSIQLDLHTSRDEAFTTFPQSHQFSRNDDVRGGDVRGLTEVKVNVISSSSLTHQ